MLSGFPSGSWIDTARNYFIKHGVLYAELRSEDGTWRQDLVHLTKNALLTNANGKFINERCGKCNTKTDFEQELPYGSWIISAKDIFYKNGILYAKLRNRFGTWVKDLVEVQEGDVLENIDGKFVTKRCSCSSEPENGLDNLPIGNWQRTAKNITVKDNLLYAELLDDNSDYRRDVFKLKDGVKLNNENGRFVEEDDLVILDNEI